MGKEDSSLFELPVAWTREKDGGGERERWIRSNNLQERERGERGREGARERGREGEMERGERERGREGEGREGERERGEGARERGTEGEGREREGARERGREGEMERGEREGARERGTDDPSRMRAERHCASHQASSLSHSFFQKKIDFCLSQPLILLQ